MQPQNILRMSQRPEKYQRADSRSQHRSQCYTHNAPAQHDKGNIQRDIHKACHNQRHQWRFRVPSGAQDSRLKVVDTDKGQPQQVHAQISFRHGFNFRRHLQPFDNRPGYGLT